jgi:2-amino-4-hydroxy-6-hydroxymethyldihydropteridine diphosphokinase
LTERSTDALVALGANLPDGTQSCGETLRAALAALAACGLVPQSVSRLYRTPAVPAGSGPDYVNAAARMRWPGSAADALAALHAVEARFGRTRTARWASRTLDLDLLALGAQVLPDAETQTRWRRLDPALQRQRAPDRLILPHPRMQDRAFVLIPLAEVAPDWRHPLLGLTVVQMRDALPPGAAGGIAAL